MKAPVDVLAVALFAAYSRNSGNPPEAHFDRSAAEQWMALALTECGVAELIEQCRTMLPRRVCLTNTNVPDSMEVPLIATMGELRAFASALARVQGGSHE